jgi:hypothetical protein
VGFHANQTIIIIKNTQANVCVKNTHKLGNKSSTTSCEFNGWQDVKIIVKGKNKTMIALINNKSFVPCLLMYSNVIKFKFI